MTRDLVRKEGLFCGGSGGAAVAGAIKYAKKIDRKANILVLLPDGAAKYISKIFNDDWMRENGFLDDAPGLGTVRELLARKDGEVVTAKISYTVRQVIDLLKGRGFSQVPVVDDGGKLRGIVHEVDLLRFLAQREGSIDAIVEGENLIESDYATVTSSTRVELLQGVLAEAKIALVLDGDNERVVGVITKIDLIDYLAGAARR
jgi:cystathionine beta-synthase